VRTAETKYEISFPEDLKAFLQVGVPPNWHNWRELVRDDVVRGSPQDTISTARDWHATPADAEERRLTLMYPLIPIYENMMMPSVPSLSGFPVFRMYDCSVRDCCDNIVYGSNLWEYLERDDHVREGVVPHQWKANCLPLDHVPFWPRFIS